MVWRVGTEEIEIFDSAVGGGGGEILLYSTTEHDCF